METRIVLQNKRRSNDLAKNITLKKNNKLKERFSMNLQIGYSYLLSTLQIDTTGAVPKETYDIARKNILNPITVKLGFALDIPSRKRESKYYNDFSVLKRENDTSLQLINQLNGK